METLIDSGADFCIFHSEIAEMLGIKWRKGHAHDFLGITGECGKVYFHPIKIKSVISPVKFRAGFPKMYRNIAMEYLDRRDFLKILKSPFSLKSETMEISKA